MWFNFALVYAIRRVQADQVKVKFSLHQSMKTQRRSMWYSSIPCFNSALEGGVWAATRPHRFTSVQESVLIVQEVGWATGSVWRARCLNPRPSNP
jgi:hypothetical protein